MTRSIIWSGHTAAALFLDSIQLELKCSNNLSEQSENEISILILLTTTEYSFEIHSINYKQFIIQFWKWCVSFLTLKLFIWSFLEICELLWIIVHPVPYCLHGFKKCAMKLYLVLYNGLKHCFEIEIFFLHMFKNLGTRLANNTQSQFM